MTETVHHPYAHISPTGLGDGDGDAAAETRLYDFPQQALTEAKERWEGPRDVCIVGGGIAGLTAAYELSRVREALGDRVTVFERSESWGGRLRTADFGAVHAELGAMRIPLRHRCTRHYLSEFNIPTRPFISADRFLFLEGRRETFANLSSGALGPPFQTRARRIPPGRPGQMTSNPFDMLGDLLADVEEKAFSSGDWLAAYGCRSLAAALSPTAAENIGLAQWMAGSSAVLAVPGGQLLPPEAFPWEYVGRATGHLWMERASLLQWLIDGPRAIAGRKIEPVGGMSDLVDAFRGALETAQARLELRATVSRIDVLENERVSVTWTRGRDEFDYVICTVPAPALCAIEFLPKLDARVRQSLTNLTYIPMAKVVVHTRSRPWELEDGVAGGATYTDLPNQQIWYPNDNAVPIRQVDSDDPAVDYAAMAADPDEGAFSAPEPLYEPRSGAVSAGEAALTAAYMWGKNARRFIALTDREKRAMIVASLAQIHPGLEIDEDDIRWALFDGPDLGGGAFAYFAPLDQSRYQEYLLEPHPLHAPSPRIFFAGEHCLPMHGWIQTAIQTAVSSAINVLRASL
jgi:monoamine oxidase